VLKAAFSGKFCQGASMSNSSRGYVCLLLTIAICSSLSYGASADRIAGTIDSNHVVELTGHVSIEARSEFDQGPVDPSQNLRVTMLLMHSAEQEQALQSLLAEQQDRKSPQYHKWLTAPQFADEFGLSKADIAKISSWLQSQGFKVTYVANGRDFISFQGTAAQMQSAFRTQIHNFNVKGKMHFANVTAPSIPAALGGIVGGFRGLHNFFPHSMLRRRPNYSVSAGGNEFYTYLAPGDVAKIYDINPLYSQSPAINGSGQKVVIAGQSDVYQADINYFRGAFGQTQLSGCNVDGSGVIRAGTCSAGNFQMVVPADGSDPGPSAGDLGESDLDIQVMGSVAPGATIVFVTSGDGVDDSVAWAVDQNPPLAKVISYSYGLCEPLVTAPSITATEPTYEKANSEGVSFFAASGDDAAATCDGEIGTTGTTAIYGQTVSYPASSPNATGVGGTEFNEGTGNYWNPPADNTGTGASALSYIPEIGWNDTMVSGVNEFDGSGGGPSNCAHGTTGNDHTVEIQGSPYAYQICDAPTSGGFAKPSWQGGGITPNDSVRDVPDIAFSASNVNDPYIVCVPESELPNGSGSTSSCANGVTAALQPPYPSAFGGTSASTPVTAGMFVLINQLTGSDGQGLVNQQLYSLFQTNPSVFNTIESVGGETIPGSQSTNFVTCTDGTPSFEPSGLQCSGGSFGYAVASTKTYNEVTGLGSVDINAFVTAWAGAVTDFTVAAGAVNPTSVVAGSSATTIVTIAPVSGSGFTGNVTLSCPNTPTGISCPSFTPSNPIIGGSGTATATIQVLPNVAAGSYSVTIKGTSGSSSTSTTVLLTVTATTQSFTLTPQNATYNVTPGQTATVTVAVSSTNGFVTGTAPNQTTTAPLTWSCSDPASESTCTIATPTTSATSVSFTVTTTAPTGQLRRPLDRSPHIFYAALLPGLLGIVFTLGSRKRDSRMRRGLQMLGLIVVLAFSMLGLNSCSGSNNSSSSNPGTPANSYTINISATTGGGAPITGTTSVTLAVQ
jgi:subtilase family serine protease